MNSHFDSGNRSNFEGPTHISDSVALWAAQQEKHDCLKATVGVIVIPVMMLSTASMVVCLGFDVVSDLLASPQNNDSDQLPETRGKYYGR